MLSMTYGFFGKAELEQKGSLASHRPSFYGCLLIHLCWGVAAFGALAAIARTWWLLGLGAMWGVVSMRICLGFNYGSLNLPVDGHLG